MDGMHLKGYDSRVWTTECILRPTIRGFGLGMHLKAHYVRLGGPAKASTFKVAKIDPLEALSHTARGQNFIKITFAGGPDTPGAPFLDDGLQNLSAVGLKMDKMLSLIHI